jgi:hypothetical protein
MVQVKYEDNQVASGAARNFRWKHRFDDDSTRRIVGFRTNGKKEPELDFQSVANEAPRQQHSPQDVVGRKDDTGKPRFDLMPAAAELKIAEVLEYGARKYAPDNWRKVENPESRYLAAALRHINAWRRGESRDPESGLSHLAHAATSLMFVMELVSDEYDDV